MTDIALLVIEELERRNSLQKEGEGEKGQESVPNMMSSCLSVLVRGFKEIGLAVKEDGKIEQLEFGKRILEPKTSVGFAAINGFFSA